MPTTGTLGKYRIVREIARSNDIVYEAFDPAMERRVAIKELCLSDLADEAACQDRIGRFYREAKAMGRLAHQNIVTIFDVAAEGDRHYIVMEYLDGRSLRTIEDRQGAVPVPESLEVVRQLCDCLAYAHECGVIHRDVKPDNVHILSRGVVKLTDFGIARLIGDPCITAQGQFYGTAYYMSPEQLAGVPIDTRTDIFSLGVLLYEMLAGRRPFVGDSLPSISYSIVSTQPDAPPGLPPGILRILERSLAKDARQRYQTMDEMAVDVAAELAAITAPAPAPAPAPVWPPPRRPDDGDVSRAAKVLAEFIGPFAKSLAKRAAREAPTVDQLYAQLSEHLSSSAEKDAFYKKLGR